MSDLDSVKKRYLKACAAERLDEECEESVEFLAACAALREALAVAGLVLLVDPNYPSPKGTEYYV